MSHATLLFAYPSFWEGFGRVLDAGGVLTEFNTSLTPQQADRHAIRSDWAAVGADLWASLLAARAQLPESARGSKQSPQEEE
jgi:hypothetical protein